MKSERQLGNWSGYQSLPLCLCAFVCWPSKASIAILPSHRIGLLYKNTPASILQGWIGAKGVGAAGGEKEGNTEYSSEISLLHPAFWVHFIPIHLSFYVLFSFVPFLHSTKILSVNKYIHSDIYCTTYYIYLCMYCALMYACMDELMYKDVGIWMKCCQLGS